MENSATKSAKELRDEKQRDSKLEEQIIRSLGNSSNIDEKFNLLLKKYIDIEKDGKKLNSTVKLHDKRYEALLREKDNLQKEHNKSVLMRDKLEQVCREQQKLIKSVQTESLKHKETQAKFQHSINEISSTLGKNNDENMKLKEDNIEMTKKLKYLAEQYQIREKQLEKINEQINLESQLHEAKLAKVQMEGTIEKEILLREKQGTLDELLKCKKTIQEMQKREELLKEQLNLYTTKYDDFQSSLQKSNDIFVTYKTELEKMVKKTKKLEKESSDWKRKCEKSTSSLLDLATEKQVKDEHIVKTARQLHQLQKLLRTLQAERTILYQVLKDNNIETPPMPVLPPEPEPVVLPPIKQQPDKMEVMAKNCADLKQSLAMLQGQVSALTTKKTDETKSTEDLVESSKRSKNKKTKTRNKVCPTKERNQSNAEQSSKTIENEGHDQRNTANEDSKTIENEGHDQPNTAKIENEGHDQPNTANEETDKCNVVEKGDLLTSVDEEKCYGENSVPEQSNLIEVENIISIIEDLKIDDVIDTGPSNSVDQPPVADNSWELVQSESICESPNKVLSTDVQLIPQTNSEITTQT